jgi:hypothetical protein
LVDRVEAHRVVRVTMEIPSGAYPVKLKEDVANKHRPRAAGWTPQQVR